MYLALIYRVFAGKVSMDRLFGSMLMASVVLRQLYLVNTVQIAYYVRFRFIGVSFHGDGFFVNMTRETVHWRIKENI